mgnify:CR=1 FL=1
MNYVPNTEDDVAVILKRIGVGSVAELFDVIPPHLRRPRLDLPTALSEVELMRELTALARHNVDTSDYACFLGAGAYNHFIPAVVRHVTGRSEFYTAYTPYQPEISQGTLQSIFEYQSVVCELTGMEVANASMYDGATAAAEAVNLARNVTGRRKAVVAPTVHPDCLSVLKTYARESGSIVAADWGVDACLGTGKVGADDAAEVIDAETACVLVQQPNFFGCLEDVEQLAAVAHGVGALFVVIADMISLALLKPPGALGADVVVGEGQSLGNPLSFGGPYLGVFATRDKFVRQMPGRIVGKTVDNRGQTGYVLTLQTREQHIRREKSTSNICSNEALNALAALSYVAAMGKQGMRRVAELCTQKAHYAASQIAGIAGFSLPFSTPFFKEFVVRSPRPPAQLNAELLRHRIIGGYELGKFDRRLSDCLLLCVTEMNTREEIDRLVAVLGGRHGAHAGVGSGGRNERTASV